MAYSRTTWVEEVTPLSAANMNNIEDGIEEALTDATTSVHGLMSAADKTKLDGIEAQANKITIVDNLTSSSSTSALSAKQGKILKDLFDSAYSPTIVKCQTASGQNEAYTAGDNTISFEPKNNASDIDSNSLMVGFCGISGGQAIAITGVTFYNDHSINVSFKAKTSGQIASGDYLCLSIIL